MNDYPYLIMKFVSELEKKKYEDKSFYLKSSLSMNQILKEYTKFAMMNGLGSSKSCFEKGLLAHLLAWNIFHRHGRDYLFSESAFKEFKENFETKEAKK